MPSSRDYRRAGEAWQPVGARLHNAFVDSTTRNIQPTARPSRPGELAGNVDIKVEASTAIQAGGVSGYGDPQRLIVANEDAIEHPVFEPSLPQKMRWGVARRGIGAGEVGPLTIRGVVWAQVDVIDRGHQWVDVSDGTLTTQADPGYALIKYQPPETGVHWCILDLGWPEQTGDATPNESSGDVKSALCCLVDELAEAGAFETPDREKEVRDCTGCPTGEPCEWCEASTPISRQASFFGASITPAPDGIPDAVLEAIKDEINGDQVLAQNKNDPCVYIRVREWEVKSTPITLSPNGVYRPIVEIRQDFAEDRIILRVDVRVINETGGAFGGGTYRAEKNIDAPYDCDLEISDSNWSRVTWTDPLGFGGIDFAGLNSSVKQAPAGPPPIERVFETLEQVPDASQYQSGESIRVVNDGANNGTYLATGSLGETATAIRKNQDVFQEAWNEPCEFACLECDGGIMQQVYLTIEKLVDTTEDEFDGWAAKLNGVWRLQHRSGVVLASALDIDACNPGMERSAPDNADATNPTWPKGPFAVQWIADKATGAVRLKFAAGEAFDGSGPITTEFEEAAATPFPRTGGDLICGSRYDTWDAVAAENNRFQDWLSNGTFTINSV